MNTITLKPNDERQAEIDRLNDELGNAHRKAWQKRIRKLWERPHNRDFHLQHSLFLIAEGYGIICGFKRGRLVTIPTLSEVEVIELIEKAQKQLDEYMRLATLGSANASLPVWTATPQYSWDNPTELIVTDGPYAFVVSAPAPT